jgi:SNF family Na+-dependent transporter
MTESTPRRRLREHWNTRLGVILAVAGSAIGLGNFLRFPGLAAQYGGGAFMIAYFCAFLLLGLPICWVEWTMGRRAGRHGLHGIPFMLVALTKMPKTRFVGVFMLLVPIAIYIYYINIEAWCLGYAVNFACGGIDFAQSSDARGFFANFVGLSGDGSALGIGLAKSGLYLGVCIYLNFLLLYKGISRGIEKFCLYATPALFVIALVVLARVLTLGTPNPALPQRSIANGLGYMWNPDKVVVETRSAEDPSEWVVQTEILGADSIAKVRSGARKDPEVRVSTISMWRQLQNPEMWMRAAAQIFFSLSVGFCLILTYASYLRRSDDVVLSALSATSANEFAEVGLGGMITIPAGYAFLGVVGVAGAGTFGLGFSVLPMVFSMMPGGAFFGALFFSLLFIAAVTSSISMLQPALAYVEEAMPLTRRQSVGILCTLTTLGAMFVAYFSDGLKAMDTLDFWFGTFMIFVLATIQMVIFSWITGVDTIFREMKYGASFLPPRIFRFVIRWVSPLFLIVVGGLWGYYDLFNLGGGKPSSYVRDLFIRPDSVAVMTVLFVLLMAFLLTMILPPRAHFEKLSCKAAEVERKEEV